MNRSQPTQNSRMAGGSKRLRSAPIFRCGMSLLEVILAIAILGMSMVAISELANLGFRAASSARMQTDATIHCDTKMAELAAGVLELSSVSLQPIEEAPEWAYSINVQSSDIMGLLSATVTVTQANTSSPNPVTISLTRFMPDPDYDPEEVTQ